MELAFCCASNGEMSLILSNGDVAKYCPLKKGAHVSGKHEIRQKKGGPHITALFSAR